MVTPEIFIAGEVEVFIHNTDDLSRQIALLTENTDCTGPVQGLYRACALNLTRIIVFLLAEGAVPCNNILIVLITFITIIIIIHIL